MAEFRLGRIKFIWKGDWVAGTQYVKDDVVRVSGKVYVCTISHIADPDFNVDADYVPPKWNLMADGQEWRGDWDNNVVYYVNDLVKYGGNVYLCLIGHTSAATDTLGLEADFAPAGSDSTLSKWDLFAESFDWQGDWTTDYRYKTNDIVKYGGNVYLCNTGHTSGSTVAIGLEGLDRVVQGQLEDFDKWDIYTEGFDWKANWTPSTRYKINDVVRFGGTLYICNEGHTAAADFDLGLEDDQSKWDYFNQGIEYKEYWDNSAGLNYKVNDVVKYGGGLYICLQKHKAINTRTFEQDEDAGYWAQFVEGFEFDNSWNISTVYQPGDLVTYGGYAYIATTNHTGIAPTDDTSGSANWDLYQTGFSLKNDWTYTTDYRVGDVVRVNGYTYVAVSDSPSLPATVTASNASDDRFTCSSTDGFEPGMSVRFTGTTFGNVFTGVRYYIDTVPSATEFTIAAEEGGPLFALSTTTGSMTVTVSAEPPNTDFWERLNSGFRWLGQWQDDYDYVLGDVVRYGNSSFVCVLSHHSQADSDSALSQGSLDSRPDQDLNGTYWNLMAAGDENNVVTTTGDMVIYSGAGPSRLPIGNEGQVLAVNNGLPEWKYWGVIDQLYYVGGEGVDSPVPSYGVTSDRPWKTVRYAAEQIEKGARNPHAAELIRRNRAFIADETVEWIDAQITAQNAPFTSGFVYDKVKCRRDVGLIVDALIWDISHGGNVETRKATLEYINNGSQVYALGQEAETVAALQYAIDDIIQNAVLLNAGPASSYGTITQFTDLTLEKEAQVDAEINSLKSIIYTAVASGDANDVDVEVKPQRTILIKTGVFYEVLPIRVPTDTAIVGDELRSTNVRPAASLVSSGDVTYTVDALGYLKTIIDDVMSSSAIGSPAQSNVLQYTNNNMAGIVTTGTGLTTVKTNADIIYDIIDLGAGSVPGSYTMPAPHFAIAAETGAHEMLLANVTFLQEEIGAWLAANQSATWNSLTTDQKNACKRDTGYIVEALAYDIRYGGNTQSHVVARSFYTLGEFVEPAEQKPATLAAYAYLKSIIGYIATGDSGSWTKTPANAETQVTTNTDATATEVAVLEGYVQDIYDTIDNFNNLPTEVNVDDTIGGTTLLIENHRSYTKIFSNVNTIASDCVEFVKSTYPNLVFDHDLCERDSKYLVQAIARDILFEADFASIVAGRSYLRSLTSTNVVLTVQKTAQLALINFIKYKLKYEAAYGSNHATELLDDMIAYINTGARPPLAGRLNQVQYADLQNGADLIYANKDFLAEEAVAYINTTYPSYAGNYNAEACKRDVREFMEALWRDIKFTGNYSSIYAARFYYNAVHGSITEDMYYVRNGTGIRNQTVQGLTGTLGPLNSFGTRRPSAGAYVSLDPGWGPNDTRAWTTNKSCYVQNVTTFGTACVGCKIDGSLHAGGNDSIVSNDFTQVLSDGIGVWCTNLGRTELVSVFSYYGHIGYLAENGGKIRATNGNSSYGTFGTVSEGVDITETPITGTVDNRNFNAAANVITDGTQKVWRLEFANAGSHYQEASYQFNGAGINLSVEDDERRDEAVFQVRMLDLNDSSGQFGGSDYVQIENVAQGGTTSSITISATDSAQSADYVGTRIFIQAGLGAGQTGIIDTYNAGSKIATIVDSYGNAGWEHAVPGTPITAPDPSSLYVIEPRITIPAPTHSVDTLSLSPVAEAGIFHPIRTTYQKTWTDQGNGDAVFDIVAYGFKYYVTLTTAGTGYSAGDSITILGSNFRGIDGTNDLTITVDNLGSVAGDINAFTTEGEFIGGRVVTLGIGNNDIASLTLPTGEWDASVLLPTTSTWSAIGAGLEGDPETGTVYFVALASGSDAAAYSTNGGESWSAATTPQSGAYEDVAYGAGKFVAVRSDSATPVISNDGTTWANGGNTIGVDTDWKAIAYGQGIFVTVSASGTAAKSTDGINWTGLTVDTGTPVFTDVEYGNGRFVAVTDTGVTYVCVDQTTFVAGSTVGSGTATRYISYGQGNFIVVENALNTYHHSKYGLEWTTVTSLTLTGNRKPTFANINHNPYFYVHNSASGSNVKLKAGAQAEARAKVEDGKIFTIRMIDAGSGYDPLNPPTITITDPQNVFEAPTQARIGNGALGNPSFVSRGTAWDVATVTITGDGYGDFYQAGSYVQVRGLQSVPLPGSNVEFASLPGQYFKLVTVTQILGTPGPYTARFQLSPAVEIFEAPEHNDTFEVRIRYSQCRLTGHDFLDIGTGNFTSTNYPNIPLTDPVPASETIEQGGGRVFFTSTDQDGNFRVGDLFTVEQATGTATLNADAFNIAGLQELQLGSVELGTGGASINEFSTDPFFTQDSDSVIPTQRAIKAYIASQIGSGSSTLNVNTLTAGQVFIADNYITTTSGNQINVEAKLNFKEGVNGVPVALNMFLHG